MTTKREFKELARQMQRRAKRNFAKLKRQLGTGERRILIEAMPTIYAMMADDPRWAKGAIEFMANAFASANGHGKQECFGCMKPWTLEDRTPVVLVRSPRTSRRSVPCRCP
jgi:hypothetical protein